MSSKLLVSNRRAHISYHFLWLNEIWSRWLIKRIHLGVEGRDDVLQRKLVPLCWSINAVYRQIPVQTVNGILFAYTPVYSAYMLCGNNFDLIFFFLQVFWLWFIMQIPYCKVLCPLKSVLLFQCLKLTWKCPGVTPLAGWVWWSHLITFTKYMCHSVKTCMYVYILIYYMPSYIMVNWLNIVSCIHIW